MKQEKVVSNEEALQNFLLDIECLDELLPWTGKFNIFDVLKASRNEIRHSNMLSWLLNPNENHGLGDAYLRGIIQRLVENDSSGRYDVIKMLLLDMYSFSVYREWKNIDILLVSSEEKVLIAIENKVGSCEHSNQLNRYREILERNYADYKRIHVFLTPDGEEPSDVENWDILTYTDIIQVLEGLYNKLDIQPDVKVMIRDYIQVVRRDIVEDEQLIEICNKIYNKHKKALDLIFENRIDGTTQISDCIMNVLAKLSKEGQIIYDEEWENCVFRTKEMDEVIPLLDEAESSWGSYNCYSYWFNIMDNRFYVVFEITGLNIKEEVMENMQRIIDELKPGDKRRENFKFKRLFKTRWYDLNDVDDIEVEVEKAVREAVKEIKEMEKRVLENVIA